MRSGRTLLVLALIGGCRSTPPEPKLEPPHDPSLRAVAALHEARAALSEWRAQIGSAGEVDAASLREVSEATQGVGTEVKALGQRVKRAPSASAAAAGAARESQPSSTARTTSREWTDDIRALGADAAARRERALEAVRAALRGSDTDAQTAALLTLQSVGDVEFDKASFRPLVLPFAEKSSGAMLVAALYALANTKREAADLALVHAGWERDPVALRDSVLHLLYMFGDGNLEGRSEDIALEWLSTYTGGNRGINGMWGARVGPRLEARVIELARSSNSEIRHAAIYFGLSTFDDKSAAVVDELIAALADPDFNNWERALWGLGHGVPEAQQPRVVEALTDLHNNRSDPQTRASCRRIVTNYGGDAAAGRLAR